MKFVFVRSLGMRYKYNTMNFGKKKDRIIVLHFKKPIENGLAGMISSRSFSHNIGIVVPQKSSEDLECDFACLASSKEKDSFRVIMEEDIFYGIKRNNIMARTILFHELGHYYYKHLENGLGDTDTYDSKRLDLASQGEVLPEELEADAFATKYLGCEYVMTGLKMIISEITQRYEDVAADPENLKTAIEELNRRIEFIANSSK